MKHFDIKKAEKLLFKILPKEAAIPHYCRPQGFDLEYFLIQKIKKELNIKRTRNRYNWEICYWFVRYIRKYHNRIYKAINDYKTMESLNILQARII